MGENCRNIAQEVLKSIYANRAVAAKFRFQQLSISCWRMLPYLHFSLSGFLPYGCMRGLENFSDYRELRGFAISNSISWQSKKLLIDLHS